MKFSARFNDSPIQLNVVSLQIDSFCRKMLKYAIIESITTRFIKYCEIFSRNMITTEGKKPTFIANITKPVC